MAYIVGKSSKQPCSRCEAKDKTFDISHVLDEKVTSKQQLCEKCIDSLSGADQKPPKSKIIRNRENK